jgi:hypothetical protein
MSPLLKLNAQLLSIHNPYSIGPEGRSVEDLKDFAKPNQMMAILPNRPVEATDSLGNKQYFTPMGKLAVSVSKDGQVTYSLNGIAKTFDAEGKLISTEKNLKGTNLIEVRNEFGEILSYKETCFGGNVVKEYDKDKNLTKTYTYNSYGKTVTSITNELTHGKTIYEKGLVAYDVDYEGNLTAKYEYDNKNKLILRTDMYGNKTHYDEHRNVTYTENKDGIILEQYNYLYDKNGDYVLDNTYDPSTRETTYYKNGRQQYTKNAEGAVVIDYSWNGSKLMFTFNRTNQETIWYDIDGRTLYTTFNDEVISKNLYYKGQLVGVWNARDKQITVFKNGKKRACFAA